MIIKSETVIQQTIYQRIVDKKYMFLLTHGKDPNVLIIPEHYTCLFDNSDIMIDHSAEYFMGMEIIESPACKTIEEIEVF